MVVKGEQKLIKIQPISQEDIDAGMLEGYYPNVEGGSTAFFKEGEPFSLLHELSHARAGHSELRPTFSEVLQREIEAAEQLVYQLVDAGVWNKEYKRELVDQLTNYFEVTQGEGARAKAYKVVSDFERGLK